MKKISLLFPFLLSLNFFCFGQESETEYTFKKTIITGKIKKYKPNGKYQQINLYIPRPENIRQEIHRVDIAPDGTFAIPFELAFPQEMTLDYKARTFVLVNPGDSISLNFNGTTWNEKKLSQKIKFSGDNAKKNKEWADFRSTYLSVGEDDIYDAQKKMDFNAFCNFRLRYKIEIANNISKFSKERKPSKELIEWLKNKNELEYFRDIIFYPKAHAYYNRLIEEEVLLSSAYYDCINTIPEILWVDLSNASSLGTLVSNTRSVIATEVRRDTAIKNSDTWHKLFSKGLKTSNFSKSSLFFQLILSQRALTLININELAVYQKYYEPLVKEYVKHPYLTDNISKKLKEKLFYDKNPSIFSEKVKNTLNKANSENPFIEILEQHKGKVIYLDFWGTWCGPCIAEFPNSKKLHELLAGSNIEFVYACIDSKERVWEKSRAEHQLKGSHYFFNKRQSDEIRKALNLNGIPFYLIIDKNGNIIDKGSHIRPGFKKTRDKLYELLD